MRFKFVIASFQSKEIILTSEDNNRMVVCNNLVAELAKLRASGLVVSWALFENGKCYARFIP